MEPMATNHTDAEADEIARAEERVRLSRAELSRSLHRVEQSSEKLARRLGNELKPTVAAAAAVAGAALVIGITVAVMRRRKQHEHWFGPERPSPVAVAAKAAGLWLLRVV